MKIKQFHGMSFLLLLSFFFVIAAGFFALRAWGTTTETGSAALETPDSPPTISSETHPAPEPAQVDSGKSSEEAAPKAEEATAESSEPKSEPEKILPSESGSPVEMKIPDQPQKLPNAVDEKKTPEIEEPSVSQNGEKKETPERKAKEEKVAPVFVSEKKAKEEKIASKPAPEKKAKEEKVAPVTGPEKKAKKQKISQKPVFEKKSAEVKTPELKKVSDVVKPAVSMKEKAKKGARSSRKAPVVVNDESVVPPEWNWFSKPMKLEVFDGNVRIDTSLGETPLNLKELIGPKEKNLSPEALIQEPVRDSAPDFNTTAPAADKKVVAPFSGVLARVQLGKGRRIVDSRKLEIVLPSQGGSENSVPKSLLNLKNMVEMILQNKLSGNSKTPTLVGESPKQTSGEILDVNPGDPNSNLSQRESANGNDNGSKVFHQNFELNHQGSFRNQDMEAGSSQLK